MKKIEKKFSAILLAAICCGLLFPVTARAEEVIEGPIQLPETMTITKHIFVDSGELDPETIRVNSQEDGSFSFEIPAKNVSDLRVPGDNHSITAFRVEGKAIYSIDTERESKFGALDSRWIKGEFTVPEDIVYTILSPSVSEDYSNIQEFRITPKGGTFESDYQDNGLEQSIYFSLNVLINTKQTNYDMEGGSETTENSYEDTWRFNLDTVGFADPYPIENADYGAGAAENNKTTKYKGEFVDDGDGTYLRITWGTGNPGQNEAADPVSTISISVLAILLAILFGNMGGAIPTVPMGSGGGPTPPPSGSSPSRWMRFDEDGDIQTTDPVNGQKRTFVDNGDGTYTEPVSGATYTPEELSQQMEYRGENAGTIRQDEARFEENVSEDRQRNQERSDESRQLEKDLKRERQERAQKEKIERFATKLGISGASKEKVIEEMERRKARDEEYQQKMNDYAERRDTAVDVLEKTVEVADYTMAAGEALVPGGKTVSATYKGLKNVGSTMMEKGGTFGSFVEGAIKGGTEAATTVIDNSIGKAATAIGGAIAGDAAEAVNDGKDVTDAVIEGAAKGVLNAASGAIGDAYGDVVGGDDVLNKLAETSGKLGEVGFEKNITGKVDDIMGGKDE